MEDGGRVEIEIGMNGRKKIGNGNEKIRNRQNESGMICPTCAARP